MQRQQSTQAMTDKMHHIGIDRSGKPQHRIDRFEIILDWHGRFLG